MPLSLSNKLERKKSFEDVLQKCAKNRSTTPDLYVMGPHVLENYNQNCVKKKNHAFMAKRLKKL